MHFEPTSSQPGLSVRLEDPFTLIEAPEGEYLIHPYLSRLGKGKLLLQVSPDGDILDGEYFSFTSEDCGRTWDPYPNMPFGDGTGRHFPMRHTLLADGSSLVVFPHPFSTGRKNEYILPAYRSTDCGATWERVEPAPFEVPYGTPTDFYKPSPWPWQVREWPKPYMEAIFEEYGRLRLGWGLTPGLYVLDETAVLAFLQVRNPHSRTHPDSTTICLESSDTGSSWSVRSLPGPWESSYEAANRQKKPLQGFSEASLTNLSNGHHLIIMRIGAWQRLYSARSADGCRTWSRPEPISVFGICPTILTLPDGILALASGRPDNTLSFSFDEGESWPWTLRLLDQTNPHHPSTRNNAMIQVEPGRLLYIYDNGYRRPDPEVDVPHAVVGRFVEVAATH